MQGKWKCKNCGSENEVALTICEKCGAFRHPIEEPNVSLEFDDFQDSETLGEKIDEYDYGKSIYQ